MRTCVPYLQLYLFAINGYHAGTEFNADSQIMDGLEALISELE